MTPVTKLEKWIAPKALPLLGIISVLVIGGGVATYFVREADLSRVERLEHVIQCQHSRDCREFVRRAILEILEHQRESGHGKKDSVTFRIGPETAPGEAAPPLLVQGTTPVRKGGHVEGQPAGQNPTPKSVKPHQKPPRAHSPKGTPPDNPSPGTPATPPGEAPSEEQPSPGHSAEKGNSQSEGKGNGAIIETEDLPVEACVNPIICPSEQGD